MLEYYKLGATSLLIRGYDPRPDAVQYGEELIPRLRELVADYDAAKGPPSYLVSATNTPSQSGPGGLASKNSIRSA